jgi:threonine dehydratase
MHPTYEDVLSAAARIARFVHHTPVVTSTHVNRLVGAEIFFKAENLQKVGAFKARGATNAIQLLSDPASTRGVVTHSSGNHGQAVAYASAIRGTHAVVVMPDHAPSIKIDAVRGYGAEVRIVPHGERQDAVDEIVASDGRTVIHPFDDSDVIAGQGTAALELVKDVDDLDIIVAPIGGGGLLSGSALVAQAHGMAAIGAEPELVDDAYRSMRDGFRHPATGALSVGDGLLTGIGALPFSILSALGTKILRVSDDEMLAAMRTHALRMKLLVEPSGATVLASLIRYKDEFAGKRVGAIISGGNVALGHLAE